MSCCICDTNVDLETVELPSKSGKTIKVKYCQKHLARLRPCSTPPIVKEESVMKCCGTPINSNGRCRVCGDKY